MWEYVILLILLVVIGFVLYKLRQPIISMIIGGGNTKKLSVTDGRVISVNTIDDDDLKSTKFVLGSITKVFTALSLLILHKKKKINIYDDASKYINKKELKNITILDLMNHRSGMKNYPDDRSVIKNANHLTSATDAYNSFKKEKLITKDKSFNYSNIGYIVLGKILEDVTGHNYYTVYREHVLDPLCMYDTTLYISTKLYKNEKKEILTDHSLRYFDSTAGGLSSSVNDMIKFMNFPSLVGTTLLYKMYFYNKETQTFRHQGSTYGGTAEFHLSPKKYKIDINWFG